MKLGLFVVIAGTCQHTIQADGWGRGAEVGTLGQEHWVGAVGTCRNICFLPKRSRGSLPGLIAPTPAPVGVAIVNGPIQRSARHMSAIGGDGQGWSYVCSIRGSFELDSHGSYFEVA